MPRNRVALEMFYDGAWHDLVIGDYVLAGQTINIMRGDGGESAALRPASLATALNNDDDRFRISSPESPLYGLAGRNTPIRVKVNDVTRAHVLTSSWKATESAAFRAAGDRAGGRKTGTAAVAIEAGGLLQQIGQWKDTLASPIVRDTGRLTSYLTGFWPLEDESGATSASSLLTSARVGQASGSVSFGSDVGPGGAARAVTLGSDGGLSGTFSGTSSGYQVVFAMKIPATLSGTLLQVFNWYDSAGRRYSWEVNNTDYAWHVRDADTDATITYISINRGAVDAAAWVRVRVKVTSSAGTITVAPSWYEENADGGLGTTFTFSGSAGSVKSWRIIPSTYTDGASFSSVYAVTDTNIDVHTGAVRSAFNGHAGESPADRFARLMSEKGLAYAVSGGDGSTTMGAQRPDTLLNLLRECRDTDDGLLFDTIDGASVTFLTREGRYNRTAVSIDVRDLPRRPPEVTDDLGVFNIVTVKNRNDVEATAEDSTGPYGSADTPTGIGPYERTVDVNITPDRDLGQHANWWLRRGTVGLPRYPSVPVNLATLDAARVAQIEAVDIGDIIEITGYREYPVRLCVIGYQETIGWPGERTVTFTTVPDVQFVVGVYGTGRYDSATTTLAAAAEAGQGSLSITTTNRYDVWSTTAVPYVWNVAGETMTVTAVTGASGAEPYTQTATVVRSLNGVRKRLPAGAAVHLAEPARYAL